MWYFIGWSSFLLFFKFYLGFTVVGRENVPKRGAFIFSSNHVSFFDPILLGTSINRSLNYVARENLFQGICGWALRRVHAFPVKRGKGDIGALRQALNILQSGKPLVIFPEGTRSKNKKFRRALPGVGFIVSKAQVPVIPAYVEGSFEALPRGWDTLKRHPVKVYIGKSIDFSAYKFNAEGKEKYRKISEEIMRNIAHLRDENCRPAKELQEKHS